MDTDEEIQMLCRNILYLRKNAAMTQREMAALMGISVSTLRKIEAGQLPPRLGVDAVFALADAFSIPPGSLFK